MDRLIEQILKEVDIRNNPYFVHLRDGTFEKADFIETQIQFYSAVLFFSRPMAALSARIPTPELRLEVVRNIWEEHGEGDRAKMHGSTFSTLLERLGASPAQAGERKLWPEVRIFNTTLIGASVLDDYLVGIGIFGIIELMFGEISSWLGAGIVERGWLERERMIHYNLHERLDFKHSRDFFDILRPAWDLDPQNRDAIEQGLRVGATLFSGLYEGLYRCRKRRL